MPICRPRLPSTTTVELVFSTVCTPLAMASAGRQWTMRKARGLRRMIGFGAISNGMGEGKTPQLYDGYKNPHTLVRTRQQFGFNEYTSATPTHASGPQNVTSLQYYRKAS